MEDKEHKLFHGMTIRGKPLKDCELVYKGKYDRCRLYVLKHENSFYAHAVEFVSFSVDEIDDMWEDESMVVSTVFECTAYFDGVRHLEFNRNGGDMDGYLYYPAMDDLIAMLQKVRDIELEHCRCADK